MTRKKKRHAIDLFAGAGGLSQGLHWSDWECKVAIEIDEWAAQTYEANFPFTRVIKTDIRQVDFAEYLGIDLIAGGPPCQPFSVAGKQLAQLDSRNMIPEFIRAVKEARPKAFLMENVAGLLTSRHKQYVDWAVKELMALGYSVHKAVLDAASYGTPQHRLRLFLVGVPKGTPFAFPEATHGPEAKNPYVTVGEAIAGIETDEPNKSRVFYAKNPVLRPSPWAGMLVNGQGRPLSLDAPSKTIPASAGGNRTHIIDPDGVLAEYHRHLMEGGIPKTGEVEGVRRLTIRESARLQTFGDDFAFVGPRSKQYSQIGNAVPPLLAKAVGRAVYEALDEYEATSRQEQIAVAVV